MFKSIYIWEERRARIAFQTHYKPRKQGGIQTAKLKFYYQASVLTQLIQLYILKDGSKLNKLINLLSFLEGLLLKKRSPSLAANSILDNTHMIWDKLRKKLAPSPSPIASVLNYNSFSPGYNLLNFGTRTKSGIDYFKTWFL